MPDENFIPGITDKELNGPGPELGVFIVVPKLPGRPDSPAPLGETTIRFIDQPALVESRSARYTPENLLHAPESFNAFEGTDSREFQIEGRFFSQNSGDIEINNQILHVVRSLVMPDYNRTGAPPTPVRLFAYGSKNIHALPCLVKTYTMNYPNDVDYIVSNQTQGDVTMPVVFTLSMTLTEQHSISQLREFSLDDFRAGAMVAQGF
jgi:hypothetical protein